MKTELEFDCPWCTGRLVSADSATGPVGEALACPTCSIVVELAPDPVSMPVARAA